MKRGFIRNIISVGCLLLSALLLCVPALADANAWLNTDIDGAVTEDTPVARPQDDFNLAMNRDYILNLVIPEGNTGTGGFNELGQIVNQMRLDAIRDETLTGHDAELVRRYYNMLLDWDTRDALGVEPAMPYVNQLRAIDSLEAMTEWFADKRRGGITAFLSEGEKGGNTGCLFAYSVSNSSDDPSARVLSITPIGLSLGDPAEYTELSENGRVTKEAATAKWTALLHHLGFSEAETAKMIDNTFALEALLAAQQSDLETKKNPANQAQYWNPTDLAGIVAMCGAFPAGEILKGWGMDHVNQYDVTEPAYMKALADIYTAENLELLRDWLTVRTTEQWANYLDKDTRDDVKAAYDGALGIRGTEGDELEAAGIIFNDLGIPADNLYIAKYCTPELRDEIREIIDAIIAEYHNMLAEETWLSEATREKAIEKLDNLAVRAVYPDNPDHWEDLEFAADSTLLEAALASWQYGRDMELSRVNAPVDRSEWNRFIMLTSTGNAFYNPSDNSINILAGMLNGVIYQSDYSYEQKLGTIGVIIGHEISHAFDPMGAQYDKDGRVISWWTDEDKSAFDARAKKLVDYYDNLVLFDGIKYSGTRVQGEAIADMGGMKCALRVGAGVEGFDNKKFFEAYARLWAIKVVKSFELSRAQTNEHPLAYLRTNVTVMQFDEFYKTFDVKEGDGMYMAPEDRICVW